MVVGCWGCDVTVENVSPVKVTNWTAKERKWKEKWWKKVKMVTVAMEWKDMVEVLIVVSVVINVVMEWLIVVAVITVVMEGMVKKVTPMRTIRTRTLKINQQW